MLAEAEQDGIRQMDIFHRLDGVPRDSDLRQEISILSYPFCQLSTRRGATEPSDILEYSDHNGVQITVTPGRFGLPDIQDFDVILYLVTVVNQLRQRGNRDITANDWIELDPHDFLETAHWGRGGSYYLRLQAALDRLNTTQVKTNIFAEDFESVSAEPLITGYKLVKEKDSSGRKRVQSIRIKVSEWLWHAIVQRESIIQVSPKLFEISNPTAKKIYQIVCRHIGEASTFEIGLIKLRDRCGANCAPKEFARRLRTIIEKGDIPDFLIHTRPSKHEKRATVVVFAKKGAGQGRASV